MRILVFISLFFTLNIGAQTVYRTPSGTKYHLQSCRMVNNTSALLSVEKAQKSGLSPCKICNPPYRAVLGIAEVKPRKTNGTNAKNRCLGITKKRNEMSALHLDRE